jgi:hypothetical protein
LDLKSGARVVIEPSDQAFVGQEDNPEPVECRLHGVEILAAVVAKVIEDRWGVCQSLAAGGHLAVEYSQGVALAPAAAVMTAW